MTECTHPYPPPHSGVKEVSSKEEKKSESSEESSEEGSDEKDKSLVAVTEDQRNEVCMG